MKIKGIRVATLLEQIPQEVFDSIGQDYKVDFLRKSDKINFEVANGSKKVETQGETSFSVSITS